MTAAVVALAILAASLAGALVTLGWQHLRAVEGRARERIVAADAVRQLAAERDTARAVSARLGAEINAAADRVRTAEDYLAAARQEIARDRTASVVAAPAADVGGAFDGMLQARAADVAARAAARADRRAAAAAALPGPGTATDGPVPAWTDLDGDGG